MGILDQSICTQLAGFDIRLYNKLELRHTSSAIANKGCMLPFAIDSAGAEKPAWLRSHASVYVRGDSCASVRASRA